ncbi:hypothetical protein [Streptomyces blattellae]|uniref:hypothetical protein n=1 Tax=Streptomyces blattellae TaxID=2569855 RepID=UPI001E3F9253|nr:hypothetical protein [Streptomyces blattellae]
MGLITRVLEKLRATPDITPGTITQRLSDITYKGLAKTFHLSTTGLDPQKSGALYFLFQAKGNAFRFLGRYDQVEQ